MRATLALNLLSKFRQGLWLVQQAHNKMLVKGMDLIWLISLYIHEIDNATIKPDDIFG